MIKLIYAAALLTAATLPGFQQPLHFDPAQTKVEFVLPTTLHTVHGAFALKRGAIQFDPATGKASGELVVDAASGNSGSPSRDKRMNKDILQSDRFPEIVFRPDRVDGKVALTGKSQVQLHGIFTIHGADHEITMPVQVEAAEGQYTATGHFSVPYIKWGMKNPSTFILRVNDTVEITIETVCTVSR
ncbi:MAG TPA: YceI family protein [Candidatus Sulfopaludibacter sp.]|jgi:polyisoprenoid-binding protein YceI|nr:YceI family protein [Candidatus Sulfopaludibacter sp.]